MWLIGMVIVFAITVLLLTRPSRVAVGLPPVPWTPEEAAQDRRILLATIECLQTRPTQVDYYQTHRIWDETTRTCAVCLRSESDIHMNRLVCASTEGE